MSTRASVVVALRWAAATSLLIGAGIHALAVAPHADHWPAAGVFFACLAAAQASLAALLVRSPSAAAPVAAAAASAGTVLLWLVTRTVGLPFGPEAGAPEPVATGDLVSAASSLAVLASLVPLLRLPSPAALRLRGELAGAVMVAAPVMLAAALLVAAPSVRSHGDAPGHAHDEVPAASRPVPPAAAESSSWPPPAVTEASPWSSAAEVQAMVEASYEKGRAETP